MTHLDHQSKAETWWLPKDTTCQFCRKNPASGYWLAGKGDVLVCPQCARETLPALMADTVHLTIGQEISCAHLALVELERAYWRAVACRLAHSLRELRK